MELQATALKGIVRSSDEGLFYLFPIQDVSTLQQTKAHLTCAIDVLSHPEECFAGTTAGCRAHVEQPRGGIERA